MKELFNSLTEGIALVGAIVVIAGISIACWITTILGFLIWALMQDTSWMNVH